MLCYGDGEINKRHESNDVKKRSEGSDEDEGEAKTLIG
jgi:hypothetical protein